MGSSGVDGRRCLLVLGAHRSGVAVCGRILSMLGAVGFAEWRPDQLTDAHDRILSELGSSWYDWRKLDFGGMSASRKGELRSEFARDIETQYARQPLIVLSDPRVCRFASFYRDVFEDLRVEVNYIMPVRNPLAVSASLKSKERMSESYAGLLWLRHVLEAEAHTRGLPRAIISFEEMVSAWRPSIEGLAKQLQIIGMRPFESVAAEIEAFLSAKQGVEAASYSELMRRADVSDWIKQTYDALLLLERDPENKAALGALDAIRAPFELACQIFGAAMFGELAALEAQYAAALQALGDDVADARAAFAFRQAELYEAKTQIAALTKGVGLAP